jgi:hypothetical protein
MHQRDFVAARATHLEDHICCSPQVRGTFNDLSSSSAITIVAAIRKLACARFNDDRKTQLNELLHDLRYARHSLFADEYFLRYAYLESHNRIPSDSIVSLSHVSPDHAASQSEAMGCSPIKTKCSAVGLPHICSTGHDLHHETIHRHAA